MVIMGIAVGLVFLSVCGILFLLAREVGRYAEDISNRNKGREDKDDERKV